MVNWPIWNPSGLSVGSKFRSLRIVFWCALKQFSLSMYKILFVSLCSLLIISSSPMYLPDCAAWTRRARFHIFFLRIVFLLSTFLYNLRGFWFCVGTIISYQIWSVSCLTEKPENDLGTVVSFSSVYLLFFQVTAQWERKLPWQCGVWRRKGMLVLKILTTCIIHCIWRA